MGEVGREERGPHTARTPSLAREVVQPPCVCGPEAR
eukprot:CAMPEP_0179172846 /NCGR_PEP_ID=MMETSP0796-20121207/85270_1 /TAXON_ID=73915 /ORGANISM="Pyrodinium bahamense, Strain pbaha01" /LENGTH=35 /DNA_ID= /DNA_START= /DNA_END= /DNA_ORIENTATION=